MKHSMTRQSRQTLSKSLSGKFQDGKLRKLNSPFRQMNSLYPNGWPHDCSLYFYLICDDLTFVTIQTRLQVGLFIFSVTEKILWFQMNERHWLFNSKSTLGLHRDWNKGLALGMEGMLKQQQRRKADTWIVCFPSPLSMWLDAFSSIWPWGFRITSLCMEKMEKGYFRSTNKQQ